MKTTTDMEQKSLELLDGVFNKCSGRAQVRINDSLPGYDRKRREVFIKKYGNKAIWMPGRQFIEHVTVDQIDSLENIPCWTGNNEFEISRTVLKIVEDAIRSYRGS